MTRRSSLIIALTLASFCNAFSAVLTDNSSEDSIPSQKYYALGSFSVVGLAAGIKYIPLNHFSTDVELSLIPFEGGGFLTNISLAYNVKEKSSFITGLTYSRVIIELGKVDDKDILSPWIGYLSHNFMETPCNFTFKLGYGYDFYEKKFMVPYFYLGLALPLNSIL